MKHWETLGLQAAILLGGLTLAACGTTSGGGAGTDDAGPTGGGETPTGGTGGAGGSGVTGGNGGSEPVGGEGGTAPVGGEGGTGGTGGAAVPDAAVEIPDAAVEVPDALVETPDAFVENLDGAVTPDAAVITPDAAVVPVGACDPEAVQAFFDVAVQDGPAFVAELSIDGDESGLTGSCGGDGPERAFHFVAPTAGRWRIQTAESPNGGFYDTVLYARGACDASETEVACADEGSDVRNASRIDLDLDQNEEVFLVVDAYRANTSGTALLRAETASVGGAGAACDPEGFPRGCGEGLQCLGGFDVEGVCNTVTPPAITSAALLYNPQSRTVRVIVEGVDPEDNANGLDVTLLDFTGGQLGFGAFFEADFTADAGLFTATGVSAVQPGPLPFGAIVVASDSTGARSEPYTIDALSEVTIAANGEACDPEGVRSICDGHDGCVESPAGGATCQSFDGVCADAVADLDGVMPDANGVYTWDGDTRAGADAGPVPCSNSMSPEQLVRFTAPSAGTWVFDIDPSVGESPLEDSLLAVRASCVPAGPGLACNDDGAPVRLGSHVVLELAAGEPVILQIEGYSANQGTYRLTAAPDAGGPGPDMNVPPRLDAAVLQFVPALGVARVVATGHSGDGEVSSVLVDLWAGPVQIAAGVDLFVPDAPLRDTDFELLLPVENLSDALLAATDSTSIRARDGLGSESEAIDAPVEIIVPEVLPRGAECGGDPFTSGLCAPGDFCLDADANAATPSVCTEVVAECPAEFGALPVDTMGPAPYVVQGNSAEAPAAGAARCDRGSGDTVGVHVFTAPAAGTWRFETSGLMNGDSVMAVRSACAIPEGVLACDDDGNPEERLASRADVPLEAGQTVYVAVYGFSPDRDGPYTLTIALAP